MKYWEVWKRRRDKKYHVLYKRGPSTLALIFAGMGIALWAVFFALSSYPAGLYLYYSLNPKISDQLTQVLGESFEHRESVVVPSDPVPVIARDPNLPEGQYLSIPQIGVDTTIWESPLDQYETALRKGVWRVTDFATPESVSGAEGHKPMILAAHRFGYIEWSQRYRETHSFYNLPKLKAGDTVSVVWGQRRYEYTVERVTEGEAIDDYSADLILYTCKFLVSPVRIMVYARLVQ